MPKTHEVKQIQYYIDNYFAVTNHFSNFKVTELTH